MDRLYVSFCVIGPSSANLWMGDRFERLINYFSVQSVLLCLCGVDLLLSFLYMLGS
jgi:hypothetical protein